jgi:hypothetical protein
MGIEYDPTCKQFKKLEDIDEYGVTGESYVDIEGNILFAWWSFLKKVFITDDDVKKSIRPRYGLPKRAIDALKHRDVEQLRFFYDEWQAYKRQRNIYEYDDMLQEVVIDKHYFPQPIKFMFIDEAHDLGQLQWAVYNLWYSQNSVEQRYICYDPMQTIYKFTGSNPSIIENITANKKIILNRSYRVPILPWNYAKKLAESIGNFTMREVQPKEEDGDVIFVSSFSMIPRKEIVSDSSLYLLFRTNNEISEMMAHLTHERIPVRGLGRTRTMWESFNFRNIYDLLIYLDREEAPAREEVRSLVVNLPSKLLKRGMKTDFYRRKYKFWGEDKKDKMKFEHDKISMFYSLFKEKTGSVDEVKELIMQPRVRITENRKKFLMGTNGYKDILAKRINRFIGTIHSSKGLQAENIYLFDYELCRDWDVKDETKLGFVGITRTQDQLFMIGDGFIGEFY